MILIAENSFGMAEYDQKNKIIYETYKGRVSVNDAMEVLEKCKVFAAENEVYGTFSDLSEVIGTYTMLNKYIEEEYMPIMVSKGLFCSAVVVSNDVFTQFATQDIIQRLDNFEIQTFKSVEEGKAWIVFKCSTKNISLL